MPTRTSHAIRHPVARPVNLNPASGALHHQVRLLGQLLLPLFHGRFAHEHGRANGQAHGASVLVVPVGLEGLGSGDADGALLLSLVLVLNVPLDKNAG